jgi:hypothetical protein
LPAHPGISSLVRRGRNLSSLNRYLMVCIGVPRDPVTALEQSY